VGQEFRKPKFRSTFTSRDVEVRYNDKDGVDIFATEHGLRRIIAVCEFLIKASPDVQHQHLESEGILTRESLKCCIRMFTEDEIKDF